MTRNISVEIGKVGYSGEFYIKYDHIQGNRSVASLMQI